MKRALFTGLLLLVLTGGALYCWLAYSESGLQWVYRQAAPALPAELELVQLSGSLAGDIRLRQLKYNDAGTVIDAQQVVLRWNPWALLTSRIEISSLSIEQLDIRLPTGDADDGPAPSAGLPAVQLPLDVELGRLAIDRIGLALDGRVYRMQDAVLGAEMRGSRVEIGALGLRLLDPAGDGNSSDVEISLAGEINASGDYPHDLRVDWKTALPNGAILENRATVQGDLRTTRLEQHSTGALQATLSLQLQDPLGGLRWQGDLEIAEFDSARLDGGLPVASGSLELAASGDTASARISGKIAADSHDLGKLDARFELRSLEGAQLADGLYIESLEADIFKGRLAASGEVFWSPELRWNGRLSATAVDPASLFAEWPGKLNAELHSEGRFDNGELDVSARIADASGTLRGYPFSLQGNLRWRDNGLEIESARLASGNTRASTQGRVGDKLDLDWSLASTDLAELYPAAKGQLNASGHLGGEPAAPVVRARFDGKSIRFDDYGAAAIDGDIAVDLLNWKQLDIRVTASQLELRGHRLQALKIDGNQRRITASLADAEGKARVELAGALVDRGWRGKLLAAEIDTRDYSNWKLQSPVALGLVGDAISIERMCLRSVQQAHACGELTQLAGGWRFGLDLQRFPLRLLRQWTPPDLRLDGVIDARADFDYRDDGRLLGKLTASLPASSASYPLQEGRLERFDYRLGELRLALEPGQVSAEALLVLENGDRLEGDALMPGADILDFDSARQAVEGRIKVNVRNWAILDAMLPQVDALSGVLELDIGVSGSLAEPRLQGSARLEDGSFNLSEAGLNIDNLRVDAHSDGSERARYEIAASSAGGRISIRGNTLLNRDSGWASELSLSADNLDIAVLLALGMEQPPPVEGKLSASGELQYRAPDRLHGEIRLSSAHGKLKYALIEKEKENWKYRDARITLVMNEQGVVATGAIEVGARNSLSAELDLPGARLLALDIESQELRGHADIDLGELDLLHYLVPEIDQVKGRLEIALGLNGTLANPRLSANAEMRQAALSIPRLGLKIDRIDLQGSSDAQDRFNYTLSAHSGEGQLTISGSSQLDPARGWPSRIEIRGADFEVSRIPEAQVTITPDLTITLEARSIRIEGDVLIPFARLQPKDISTAARVSSDTVIIGSEQPVEERWQVTTRVNLTLGERVTFFGFGFEGKLGGRLLMEDVPAKPSVGTGEITINEGRYRAYGQRLDINDGRLLFTGGPLDNPGLDVRALRQVNEVTVGVQLRGRLQQPEVELFSIPAMDQTDQLSYLLLGRPASTASGSEGQMMAQAALALGLAGGDTLARKVGDRFGLDEMRVESSDNGDQASLVVGRYLSPKMYVSYGVGLIESINTLTLRYELSKNWQVEAESGENVGADLLFTIER